MSTMAHTGQSHSVPMPAPHEVNQPLAPPLSNPRTFGQPQPTKQGFGVPGCFCLSVTHIVLGGVSVLLGITAVIIRCRLSHVGLGIWGGLLVFCVTGALGCFAARNKQNKGMVIAFMVMSIVAAALAFAILMVAAFSAKEEGYFRSYCYPGGYPGIYPTGQRCIVAPGWRIAVGSLLAVTALAEMVICVVSSSLCCYALNKGCTGSNYIPVVVQYVPQQVSPQFMPVMVVEQNQGQRHQQAASTQPAPVPAQYGQLSSVPYVGYAHPPPQPITMPVVSQTGTLQQLSGFPPQQIMLAPSHQPLVLATPPAAQTATPAPEVDAKRTAQRPVTQATESESDDATEQNNHFCHDDTQGLVATA